MAQYWLVRESGSEVEGPYSAGQLKAMAAAGQITTDSLISDGGQWHAATTVRGLFPGDGDIAAVGGGDDAGHAIDDDGGAYDLEPAPRGGDAPVAPSPGVVDAGAAGREGRGWPSSREFAGGVEAPPVVRYGAASGAGVPGEPRQVTWFLVLTCILLAFGAVTVIVSFVEGAMQSMGEVEPWWESDTIHASDVMGCVQAPVALGLWIYWLVWVYIVHREIRDFTGGAHSIGPGLALGLCFVPLFNLFWSVYMPYRLAQTIRDRSVQRRSIISPETVLTFQILSILPGCCLWGLSLLFTGLAMQHIQTGLNRLWAQAEG
ncbi:MAG: DUF4339 domain-containing protein [Planctomycetota bacterium]|nr:DUF4339 domain-containing protein [Planctomycetota bacterium]